MRSTSTLMEPVDQLNHDLHPKIVMGSQDIDLKKFYEE